MQTIFPTLLVLVLFLFSGLTSVHAQSLNTSPAVKYTADKVQINYLTGMDAINSLRAEMDSNFDMLNPPQDENTAANREAIYKLKFYIAIQGKIGTGTETGLAIAVAFNEVSAINEKYSGLVSQAWFDHAIDILSL